MGEMEDLLTVQEAADRLKIKPAAVYQAMNDERLPYVKVLGKRGIRPADLAAYKPRAYRERPGAKPKGRKPLQARTEEGEDNATV